VRGEARAARVRAAGPVVATEEGERVVTAAVAKEAGQRAAAAKVTVRGARGAAKAEAAMGPAPPRRP
jgi:hypothetical protein